MISFTGSTLWKKNSILFLCLGYVFVKNYSGRKRTWMFQYVSSSTPWIQGEKNHWMKGATFLSYILVQISEITFQQGVKVQQLCLKILAHLAMVYLNSLFVYPNPLLCSFLKNRGACLCWKILSLYICKVQSEKISYKDPEIFRHKNYALIDISIATSKTAE